MRFMLDKSGAVEYLRERDSRSHLEADCSQINAFFLNEFQKLHATAKFILTIREPISWLNSFVNQSIYRGSSPEWDWFREVQFGPRVFPKEESRLSEISLYPISGYLRYWRRHNETVISTVPHEKLLVVPLHLLSTSIDKIADFIGIDPNTLKIVHTHKAAGESDVLSLLPVGYLEKQVAQYCGQLPASYFSRYSKEHADEHIS